MTVFANGLEVACKAQSNQVIAAFPYVCMTPPQTPATPPGVPVPYPTFAMDGDSDKGTGSVKIGDGTVTQKNLSYYSKCAGNEAGCAPMKNVISHVNTGKDFAHAWSGNVRMDAEPVSRFSDLGSNDHASPTAGGPPIPRVAQPNLPPPPPPPPSCPCCGEIPPHAHQIDATGALLPEITEQEYYRRGHTNARAPHEGDLQRHQNRLQTANTNLARVTAAGNAGAVTAITTQITNIQTAAAESQAQLDDLDDRIRELEDARNQDPLCPNLHDPADEGCGKHFDRTGQPAIDRDDLGFDADFKDDYRQAYDDAHGTDLQSQTNNLTPEERRINHRTPLDAGGCPTDDNNLIPHPVLSPECQRVDDLQGQFQGIR